MVTKNNFRVWDDELEQEFFTPEEIAESDVRVALITSFVEARKKQGITQRQLEEMSGIKQPQIARIEKGQGNPQLDTLLRILAPLGKTLAIVPIKKNKRATLKKIVASEKLL